MKSSANSYVSSRALKLKVGFLLTDGPGYSRDSTFDFPMLQVADDLMVNYLQGPLRLSRTKEGILVQAQFHAGIDHECSRCLEPSTSDIVVELEELFVYHASADTEFRVLDDGVLDLAPLLRAEILIYMSHPMLCQPDCKGLCPNCGVNLNDSNCMCDLDDIDPRMAELKKLLDLNQ